MKVQFPNGMVVEGTLEQVRDVARTLGQRIPALDDGIWYNSTSKGLIRIADMETTHLRNALLRRYREAVANLSTLSNTEVAREVQSPSDKTLVGLMAEFVLRWNRGRL